MQRGSLFFLHTIKINNFLLIKNKEFFSFLCAVLKVARADYLTGRTALHFAAMDGHARCLRLVLADHFPSSSSEESSSLSPGNGDPRWSTFFIAQLVIVEVGLRSWSWWLVHTWSLVRVSTDQALMWAIRLHLLPLQPWLLLERDNWERGERREHREREENGERLIIAMIRWSWWSWSWSSVITDRIVSYHDQIVGFYRCWLFSLWGQRIVKVGQQSFRWWDYCPSHGGS